MTIYDWASRLSLDDSRSKSREDFLALCPCHSDTHASLHVYVGRDTGQVVMKCHACGATGKDVCEALGIDMKELFCDALSGEADERKPAAPKARRVKERKLCRGPYEVGEEWGGMRTVCVYEYTDRDGRVVLRKARREQFDENGVRVKKSFPMQSIGKEAEWQERGIRARRFLPCPHCGGAVAARERVYRPGKGVREGTAGAEQVFRLAVCVREGCGWRYAAAGGSREDFVAAANARWKQPGTATKTVSADGFDKAKGERVCGSCSRRLTRDSRNTRRTRSRS